MNRLNWRRRKHITHVQRRRQKAGEESEAGSRERPIGAPGLTSLPSGKAAQTTGIFGARFTQALGSRGTDGLNFFRPESQERGDVAYLVEFRIILYVERFDVAANHPGQNGFTDINDLLRGSPTGGTIADQMGVDVTASSALDRVSLQILSDQKSLDLAQFQRTQHAA
jgi:hypothetical protein